MDAYDIRSFSLLYCLSTDDLGAVRAMMFLGMFSMLSTIGFHVLSTYVYKDLVLFYIAAVVSPFMGGNLITLHNIFQTPFGSCLPFHLTDGMFFPASMSTQLILLRKEKLKTHCQIQSLKRQWLSSVLILNAYIYPFTTFIRCHYII